MSPEDAIAPATPQWSYVTVVGCGLIGASFALALRARNASPRIAGWDTNPRSLEEALRAGVIDEIDNAFQTGGTSLAELIYLAMPVRQIISFINEKGFQTAKGTIITDSGSTKVEICRAALIHLPEERFFVGGHPIAGSHNSGPTYAQPQLFQGAPYILIDEGNEKTRPALTKVKETVEGLGANVKLLTATEHDRAMAFVSHLPQVLSSALAATVNEAACINSRKDIAGAGYSDMTRLAGSAWSVWHDVLLTNAEPLADALELLVKKLIALREELRLSTMSGGEELPYASSLFPQQGSPK
jgi:prephenate dehydrogenase